MFIRTSLLSAIGCILLAMPASAQSLAIADKAMEDVICEAGSICNITIEKKKEEDSGTVRDGLTTVAQVEEDVICKPGAICNITIKE